ncbi:hypothetical protein DPMN_140767 [Dreissena polymorpha]|uniref:Uncharacterized protein n=1 Tax=Dreissena polymorpha TaxID=45954 RepID=A0A9D4G8Q6_DREPO|nr:hypothetical protein DPMN_140767 [Dreissena polymorpha]
MWAGCPKVVMGPCIVEIDRIVIRQVQYQCEDNRCRNEEIIFQGSSANSEGGDSGQDGRADRRTDIGDNHNILKLFKKRGNKDNFGWVWPMWPGRPRIGNGAMHKIQYQVEVNRLKCNFGWAWPMWAGHPRVGNGAMHS